jgi:type II secretory pathway pseudopilin PulG
MNRCKELGPARSSGYTIVETLIFLAVSSAMFVAAMLLISGQQNKAQFVNAVRDFETQLTDVANNVSTGYYSNPSNLTCAVDGSNNPLPTVSATATDTQGTNGKCIFAGIVLKLGDGSDSDSYSKVTMAGARLRTDGKDVQSLAEANPVAVDPSLSTKKLLYGARIQCIKRDSGPCTSTQNAAIGFFTKLAGSVTEPQGKDNTIRTDLIPYPTVSVSDAANNMYKISATPTGGANYSTTSPGLASTGVINPQSLDICILSGGTSQYALIHIRGAVAGSLSITTEIKAGSACV